ncbi:NAD(P)-binding protein [Mycolicibacterium sp. 120266]|uniref:NAD(P)-binding protein n=1 Tax=Mycolicibacterium sp. 120266 TaxID=3090601 RepID=UPI00299DA2C3|nr:NAD(P)-binding protein [Mycolicibacterium sp. 120266]MDX1872914.1 NAD(P)-binding protein [Mycolicibacterium sp. 120266]
MRSTHTPDAVVIGTGSNGVTAAAVLVAAGWDVTMLEADGRAAAVTASARRPSSRRSVPAAPHKLRC